jgi:mRNA interferase RelE/StbE
LGGGWQVVFTRQADRQIMDLPLADQVRITSYFRDRVLPSGDPWSFAKALSGEKSKWRFRIGDYRAVGEIHGDRLIIEVIRVAHRREAYR